MFYTQLLLIDKHYTHNTILTPCTTETHKCTHKIHLICSQTYSMLVIFFKLVYMQIDGQIYIY